MQKFVIFSGYWKDPLHYATYLQKNSFLPYLNNDIDHADAALFKHNICSLAAMVLVQSTKENVVDPAASSHFGFYAIGSLNKIKPLIDSEWYHTDRLGIKTLANTGRLHLKFAHCTHSDFQEDEYNFIHNTLPYLRYDIEHTNISLYLSLSHPASYGEICCTKAMEDRTKRTECKKK